VPATSLAELEGRIGHAFGDPELLLRALTHPSYAHEHPPASHNEALAFLGDAVLGLVMAELLAARAPLDGAGPLTQRRAALVSASNLAVWADRLDLPAGLYLGRGEDQGGGRRKESILATAFEAVLAALYLDGGLPPVRALIARLVDGPAV
jgi:ribonuclease III